MIVIDCDPLTIPLTLPECAGEGPFTATLSRHFEDLITLEATLDEETRALTLSGIPADTRRGVWWLNVNTSCGCYDSKVFVDMCRAPRHQSTHTPTPDGGTGEVQACCDPENVIGHFTVPPGEELTIALVDGDVEAVELDELTLTITFTSELTGTVTVFNSYGDLIATESIVSSDEVAITVTEALPCDTYAVGFTEGEGGPV